MAEELPEDSPAVQWLAGESRGMKFFFGGILKRILRVCRWSLQQSGRYCRHWLGCRWTHICTFQFLPTTLSVTRTPSIRLRKWKAARPALRGLFGEEIGITGRARGAAQECRDLYGRAGILTDRSTVVVCALNLAYAVRHDGLADPVIEAARSISQIH